MKKFISIVALLCGVSCVGCYGKSSYFERLNPFKNSLPKTGTKNPAANANPTSRPPSESGKKNGVEDHTDSNIQILRHHGITGYEEISPTTNAVTTALLARDTDEYHYFKLFKLVRDEDSLTSRLMGEKEPICLFKMTYGTQDTYKNGNTLKETGLLIYLNDNKQGVQVIPFTNLDKELKNSLAPKETAPKSWTGAIVGVASAIAKDKVGYNSTIIRNVLSKDFLKNASITNDGNKLNFDYRGKKFSFDLQNIEDKGNAKWEN